MIEKIKTAIGSLKTKIKNLLERIKNAVKKNFKKIISYVVAFFVGFISAFICGRKVLHNRNTTNELRDNVKKSERQNNGLGNTIDQCKKSADGIKSDNTRASEIIAEIRKQKLKK